MLSPLHHAAVVSLQKLGSLIERINLLLLLFLLGTKDFGEHFTLVLLLDTLSPLLLELLQLVLHVSFIGFEVFPLLGLITHVSVIRLESVAIGLVSIFIGSEQGLLSSRVLCLDLEKLSIQFLNQLVQLSHASLMRLLVLVLSLLPFVAKIVDLSVLLRVKLCLLVFELVNL